MINPGDDLAKLIVETAGRNDLRFCDGDVVVAAQKIFSKAERRVIQLQDVTASVRAEEIAKKTSRSPRFVELVIRETKRFLKIAHDVLLVEDNRGLVCINAGIDKSNVKGRENYALLPEDPDLSAERCRQDIKRLTGKYVGVVICDTYSRPFRRGQANFAIGIAGINPFRDYRGTKDLFGQTLKVKNVAVADELAAAAELLMGQGREATPVVILRGLEGVIQSTGEWSSRDLIIARDGDLFKDSL